MHTSRVLIALLLPLAGGCSIFRDLATQPPAERPVAQEDGYLTKEAEAGELGPDERLLLAEYSDTQAAKLALETQLAEARATIDALQSQLRQTEEVRDRERTGRAGAEAELARLRTNLQDRETKILNLHLEKAKLTQDLLLLKIEATERRAEVADGAAKALEAHAAPGGSGR